MKPSDDHSNETINGYYDLLQTPNHRILNLKIHRLIWVLLVAVVWVVLLANDNRSHLTWIKYMEEILKENNDAARRIIKAESSHSTTTTVVSDEQLIAQSCLELQESTVAFSNDVYNNPENTSIDIWTSTNNNARWQIPPLDHNLLKTAFQNRKISIFGDSTTASLRHSINSLMRNTTVEFVDGLRVYNLTQANHQLDEWWYGSDPDRRLQPRDPEDRSDLPNYGTANLHWNGYRGRTMNKNCRHAKMYWPDIRNHQPDILVVNWGLHMLFSPKNYIKTCNIYQWIHYEEWLEEVFQLASEAGVKLLLFKTTNRICPAVDPLKPPNTEQCHKVIAARATATSSSSEEDPTHMLNVSKEEKERYCEEGLLLEDGGERLNQRLFRFVANKKKLLAATDSGGSVMKVDIYNDHDMETCLYSDGKVHFVPLGLPRIRLLAHTISCLLHSKGEEFTLKTTI